MKKLKMIMTLGAVAALMVVSALPAQTPAAPATPMQGCAMCSQMMAQHQEIATLTEKVLASVTTLQNEKDPAELKTKLAEHAALVKELQSKQAVAQAGMKAAMQPGAPNACPMMESMKGSMGGMQGMHGGMMMGGGEMGNMPGMQQNAPAPKQ